MNLSQLIEKKGISPYRLSKMADVPQCSISLIKNGKRKYVTGETIYKLSQALDVNMETVYKAIVEGANGNT